jgi:predicted nucleic acid-binding protein
MQLVHGCHSKNDVQAILTLLKPIRLVWPSASFCDRALQTLVDLRLAHGLDLVDALIAQTAIALGEPLYTFNTKHFGPIPELKTIQPYQR